MNLNLYAQKVIRFLLYTIFFLLCMNIIALLLTYNFELGPFNKLTLLFDLNTEMNIPTFFSGFLLIFASMLLFVIALSHKKEKTSYLHWYGLAVIFLLMAIDEMVTIHERIMWPLSNLLNTSGILLFAWIIPYGLFTVFLSVVYIKFILKLPRKTLILFLLSALLYLTGALGFELIEGKYYELHGLNNIYYALLYTCEEVLEMLGVSIFIYSLLSYISNQFENYTLKIIVKN